MSAKLLMRLLMGFGALVVVWGLLALVRRPPDDRSVSLALPKVDSAKVDSVLVVKGHDTVAIVRSKQAKPALRSGSDAGPALRSGRDVGKKWTANGYAADSAAIQSLLKGIGDTGRTTEEVAVNRSSHERLGVGPDSGERVIVVANGQAQLDLVAGKRTPDYDGVYIRRASEDPTYALHGSLVESLTRPLDDWRDKRIAAVMPDSVAKIDIQRAGHGYALERTGATWKFASGKATDSSSVASLLSDYRDIRASGFPTKAQADSIDFKNAKTRARFASKSGAALVSLVFDSTASGLWVRADSGGPVFKVDSWLWGRLAPAESTLAAKKPPAPPPAAKKSDSGSAKKK